MIYLFWNNHNYLLMGCVCLLRTRSFSDLESTGHATSRLPLKKVFIYVFVRGLSCSVGDPLVAGGTPPSPVWGVRLSPLFALGAQSLSSLDQQGRPHLPFLSTLIFPWWLLSFIASADKTNLQSWFLCLLGSQFLSTWAMAPCCGNVES